MKKITEKIAQKKMPDDLPAVTREFIKENRKLRQTRPKKGGPYSKQDRHLRRNEVYRLHFDYGYSARKIADMMKINRNTINGDIQYWYSQVAKKWKSVHPSYAIIKNIERFELQETRLREELDKAKSLQEKISIERLITDVESRILQSHIKLVESIRLNHENGIRWLNKWMEKNKREERYMEYSDLQRVSSKSYQKIRQIINQDRERNGGLVTQV
ncbi:MAG: hypothetical protein HY295_06125 [Thaumarchaeota archaeon]|nr:hypothetical protein [Nitrososphaerota archaeon]